MKMDETNGDAGTLLCSVIVATWQRAELLRGTLESLVDQKYRRFEVIVVCDGEDETIRRLAKDDWPGYSIRWFFHAENRGQAAARNTGAHEARGDILLFLDDDVKADPALIAHHMEHHAAVDESIRLAVSGRIAEDRREPLLLHTDKFLQESWERQLDSYAAQFTESGVASIGDEIEKAVAFGLNCSIRRAAFLSSGGFNEFLRLTDEDMELGLRLYLSGVRFVYELRAVVAHQSTKDLTAYYHRCWAAGGKIYVYRVFELGQKNAQTRALASIHHGYFLDRLAARFCWHASSSLQTIAKQLERAANRTGWPGLPGAWSRTCQAGELWSNAKAAGCTLVRLKSAVGPARCAVLLHSVCEPESREEASYYVAPQRFHRFMRWFRASGYRTATLAQWIADDVPRKHVLLTFDDAYDDLFDELLPLVAEFHYTPLIFVVADRIGATNVWDQEAGLRARNLLTLEQIREMQKHGVAFGSHTLTHPYLPDVSDAQLRREVVDSKHRLEDLLGVEVASFAYPYGGVDRRVRSAVADAGYKAAFTTLPGLNWWNDPLCQRRAEVNNSTSAVDFMFKLRSGLSLRQFVGKRLRSLEDGLPTRILRQMVGSVRRMGSTILRSPSSGAGSGERTH